jgi:hypothetical protein
LPVLVTESCLEDLSFLACSINLQWPAKSYKVGDHIRVSMHDGKIVEAVIKAIIDKTDGLHYQIDFGKKQTALISEWQVVKD